MEALPVAASYEVCVLPRLVGGLHLNTAAEKRFGKILTSEGQRRVPATWREGGAREHPLPNTRRCLTFLAPAEQDLPFTGWQCR